MIRTDWLILALRPNEAQLQCFQGVLSPPVFSRVLNFLRSLLSSAMTHAKMVQNLCNQHIPERSKMLQLIFWQIPRKLFLLDDWSEGSWEGSWFPVPAQMVRLQPWMRRGGSGGSEFLGPKPPWNGWNCCSDRRHWECLNGWAATLRWNAVPEGAMEFWAWEPPVAHFNSMLYALFFPSWISVQLLRFWNEEVRKCKFFGISKSLVVHLTPATNTKNRLMDKNHPHCARSICIPFQHPTNNPGTIKSVEKMQPKMRLPSATHPDLERTCCLFRLGVDTTLACRNYEIVPYVSGIFRDPQQWDPLPILLP